MGRRRRRRRHRARDHATCSTGATSRIAWIGWRKDSWIGEDRRSGWSRALHARGLPTTGLASRVEDTVASGREASAVLLDEAQPSAFVCASDTLAMGVLHTLADRGLRAGRDVAVVGFDDSQVAQVVPPGLTSVRQPLEDVAVEIVKALDGPARATRPSVGPGVLLAPTLALRGTPSGGSRDPEPPQSSEVPPPEVDGVVDLGALVPGEHLVGDLGANSMRTTASRSARDENDQRMSTGVRVQPRVDQNRSTATGSTSG